MRATYKFGSIARDTVAILLISIIAYLSWDLISNAARAVYRQHEVDGDPPLYSIDALNDSTSSPRDNNPAGASSHDSILGHYAYFWSETAFHYRYCLLFAYDDYLGPGILDHDVWQQYPDGVDAWREYTIMMEPFYGHSYRLFGNKHRPLVEFLLLFVPFMHVMMFFLLYALARSLGVSQLASMFSVLLYASCLLSFSRILSGLLLKETFSLFLFAAFLAAHFHSIRRRSYLLLLLSALLLGLCLASWHLSQFLLLPVYIAMAFSGLTGKYVRPRVRPDDRPGWSRRSDTIFTALMPGLYILAGVIAAFTPSLRERDFISSISMMVLYAWALSVYAGLALPSLESTTSRRALMTILLVAMLGGLSLLNRHHLHDYSHVFGLLQQKIAHGLRKPYDPSALPFDVRIFWVYPFTTPTMSAVWNGLGLALLVLCPSIVWGLLSLSRQRGDIAGTALRLLTFMYLLAYILFDRLGPVFLVLAAVLSAMALEALVLAAQRRWPRIRHPQAAMLLPLFVIPLLNPLIIMPGIVDAAAAVRHGVVPRMEALNHEVWRNRADLFSWVIGNTPGPGSGISGPPASFLGDVGMSPQLLLYASRPVILNSQFENWQIRRRFQQYLAALFSSSEDDLLAYAQQYRARYLFVGRDLCTGMGRNALKYYAGISESISQDMTAYRLQFSPNGLRCFVPLYDNKYYRVFKVLAPGEDASQYSWRTALGGWWDEANFHLEHGKLRDLGPALHKLNRYDEAMSRLPAVIGKLHAEYELSWETSRPGKHRVDLMSLQQELAMARIDSLLGAARRDGGAASNTSRIENEIAQRLAERDPTGGTTLSAALRDVLSSPVIDGEGLLPMVLEHAGDPEQCATVAQVCILAGMYSAAADLFARAANECLDRLATARISMDRHLVAWLCREAVLWSAASGQIDNAKHVAGRCLANTCAAAEDTVMMGAIIDFRNE